MKAETRFSLADQLFNPGSVDRLATWIEAAHPEFPGDRFRASALAPFPELKLKERIAHITTVLHNTLALPFPEAVSTLLRALPPELDPSLRDNDFGDFILAPVSLYVAMHGIERDHLTRSLDALREITKRFSAEDAIRAFLNTWPDETLDFLRDCARDEHYHVRRLASEGTRPLLPWAARLSIDYRRPIGILDLLFADPTRFVTRSVANHLNDISKADPTLVIDTLRRWRIAGTQAPDEMRYITEHALRTLVKQGHDGALSLIGFGERAEITLVDFSTTTPRVRVGDAFHFSLTFQSHRAQTLLVDYAMRFAGDGSTEGGRKVFKLKRIEAGAGELVTIAKVHPMRLMTTRRLYAGEHRITLQINGAAAGTLGFDLVSE